jgi:Mg2+-importing ATPase
MFFGPISSIFDFATFGIMIWVFHASTQEFRAGWFVESLATQTLVIFAIRTRRVPFFRSRPSRALLLAAIAVVSVGAWIPASPLSETLGFAPLPAPFFATLVVMVVVYLVLIDLGKTWFYAHLPQPTRMRVPEPSRRLARRAARFSTRHPLSSGAG